MSYILSLHKCKGDAVDGGSYRGLKLTEHVMKVLEKIVDDVIQAMIDIDEMLYAFVPGCGTTDAIFIIRQLQEKYLAWKNPNGKKSHPLLCVCGLQKAFDRVPHKVLWWAMHSLGIGEWVVRAEQAMYSNARNRVRSDSLYSVEFGLGFGVHQGSVLSPLLFIT